VTRVFTDSREFADRLTGEAGGWRRISTDDIEISDSFIIEGLLEVDGLYCADISINPFGQSLFITEESSKSQYDAIIGLLRDGKKLPDGIACLADHGSRFHGLRERPWNALPGNIHLVVQFSPDKVIAHYGVGFTILAAVSVVQTIDRVSGLEGKAQTKWVNDIVVGDAKVCGVLTYTQAEGQTVTGAVIGIGLNVEATPEIEPTVFVPEAVSIRDLTGEDRTVSQGTVLRGLLARLKSNYDLLLGGGYRRLLDFYRERSAIIGKTVEIYPDSPFDKANEIITGKVIGIGDNLELYLEGNPRLATKGRLALKS